MGRRGPLPARRDREGKVIESAVVPYQTSNAIRVDVPPTPAGLLAETRRTWGDFWTSGAATWVDRGAHMHRLVRWIRDVDAWIRVQRDLRPTRPKRDQDGKPVDPLVLGVVDTERPWLATGSTGQVTRHPNAEELDKLDARIHRVEVEFGMTPYAGVRLGLAGVQGALTAEQLASLIRERAGDEPPPLDEPWAQGFKPA